MARIDLAYHPEWRVLMAAKLNRRTKRAPKDVTDESPFPYRRDRRVWFTPFPEQHAKTHMAVLECASDDKQYKFSFVLYELADDEVEEREVYRRELELKEQRFVFNSNDMNPRNDKYIQPDVNIVVSIQEIVLSGHQHKQVPIKWGKEEACVDEGIAELILLLWKNDIMTLLSCQENKAGMAWICFPTRDAEEFLSLVATHPKKRSRKKVWETMYGRMLQCSSGTPGEVNDWQYDINPFDLGANETFKRNRVLHDYNGLPEFYFHTHVRFPITDIPEIVKRLKEAADGVIEPPHTN